MNVNANAELAQLAAEQRAVDNDLQYPEHRRSISLDDEVFDDDEQPGTVGTELIGYDPWDAIDDALDAGLDAIGAGSIDSTRADARGESFLPDYLRDQPWDRETLYANGSRTAMQHPFRDVPRDDLRRLTQFEQAHGQRWRRQPTSSRTAPPVIAKLFACFTAAFGADAAREAAVRRGRPKTADHHARVAVALAVQVFREMGYTTPSLAAALDLPERQVRRYANTELPAEVWAALDRVFGGLLTAAGSEVTSAPTSEDDATMAPSTRSAPASLYDQTLDSCEETPA